LQAFAEALAPSTSQQPCHRCRRRQAIDFSCVALPAGDASSPFCLLNGQLKIRTAQELYTISRCPGTVHRISLRGLFGKVWGRMSAISAVADSGPGNEPAADGGFSLPPGRALAICLALQKAILEHRLRPGMKLSEDEVGEIFGASRTVVRAALHALAHS